MDSDDFIRLIYFALIVTLIGLCTIAIADYIDEAKEEILKELKQNGKGQD